MKKVIILLLVTMLWACFSNKETKKIISGKVHSNHSVESKEVKEVKEVKKEKNILPLKYSYKGKAVNNKGKCVYVETHHYWHNPQGELIKAHTLYADVTGKKLAELHSSFDHKISLPTYHFEDYRHGESHGIRYESKNVVELYYKNKNGKEKRKKIDIKKFKKSLVMGGQGLHYHIQNNFDKVKSEKIISTKFMIPGELDYYSFELKTLKSTDDQFDFKLSAANFAMRWFAPEMLFSYKKGRLTKYEGISNIKKPDGDTQNVVITYTYSN